MVQHFGVIGFPVEHSLSPWIHQNFFRKAGISGEYRKIKIDPDHFTQQISQLMSGNISGFNVTVPYKKDIIPFLDRLDGNAASIGAVNTVAKIDGEWIGFNTDGIGYIKSVDTDFPFFLDKPDKKVLILGAGGAARGIYSAMLQTGMPAIDIANRTRKSAEELVESHSGNSRTKVLSLREAENAIGSYDMIIQTTSVGMEPNDNEQLLSLEKLDPNAIVSDIVYKPIMTNLLKQAKKRGARIHRGHLMLLHQARCSFEIWTGHEVDIHGMDIELEAILEGR